MLIHEYQELDNTHAIVLEQRADIEHSDTMIYTIGKWHYLLADACHCQTLQDRNEDKLLVLRACYVLMPAIASQCQSMPDLRYSHSIINKPFLSFIFNDLFFC